MMKSKKKGDELSAVDDLMSMSPKKPKMSSEGAEDEGESEEYSEEPEAEVEIEVKSEEPKGDPAELIASIQAKLDELSSML